MELIGLAIALIVGAWVFSDAKSRGKSNGSAFLWFLGTFLLLIIFLPLWFFLRPKREEEIVLKEQPKLCIHCGKYYEGNPSFCPNCGQSLTPPKDPSEKPNGIDKKATFQEQEPDTNNEKEDKSVISRINKTSLLSSLHIFLFLCVNIFILSLLANTIKNTNDINIVGYISDGKASQIEEAAKENFLLVNDAIEFYTKEGEQNTYYSENARNMTRSIDKNFNMVDAKKIYGYGYNNSVADKESMIFFKKTIQDLSTKKGKLRANTLYFSSIIVLLSIILLSIYSFFSIFYRKKISTIGTYSILASTIPILIVLELIYINMTFHYTIVGSIKIYHPATLIIFLSIIFLFIAIPLSISIYVVRRNNGKPSKVYLLKGFS